MPCGGLSGLRLAAFSLNFPLGIQGQVGSEDLFQCLQVLIGETPNALSGVSRVVCVELVIVSTSSCVYLFTHVLDLILKYVPQFGRFLGTGPRCLARYVI